MSTVYSVGLMNQFGDACEAAGYTPEHLTKLRSIPGLLASVLMVIEGVAQVIVKCLIDCDAEPFCPSGWKVEEHKKGGSLEWDPKKVRFHLSLKQQGGGYVKGNKLRLELANQPVLNANVLDFLLAHPELIPEEWKGKAIFFWGTIYRFSGGSLCVRYLYWGGRRWCWSYSWLGDDFFGSSPAACS